MTLTHHYRDFILPRPLFLNSLKGILLCTYIHIYINDKTLSEYGSVLAEGWGVEGQCGRYFVLFFCN